MNSKKRSAACAGQASKVGKLFGITALPVNGLVCYSFYHLGNRFAKMLNCEPHDALATVGRVKGLAKARLLEIPKDDWFKRGAIMVEHIVSGAGDGVAKVYINRGGFEQWHAGSYCYSGFELLTGMHIPPGECRGYIVEEATNEGKPTG